MTDTLNIEDAFAQADANLNSVQETTEEPAKESEPEVEPTEVEPKVKTEDTQEPFTKFNPDELPAELKGVYKSLQADYTRKTQEAARIRKESEQRIEALEKQLSELAQPSKPVEQTQEDALKTVVKQELESEKVSSFREKAIQDYEAADPRLKMDSDTYDKPTDLYVGQEMDERLDAHIKAGKPQYTFEYGAALKEVLHEWDEYVQSKNKAFLEAQQKQAEDKSKAIGKLNPKGKSAASVPKKPTLDEALAIAASKV